MREEADGSEADEPAEIPVWWTHWTSVEVFERCELSVIGGMSVHYQGITATEIRSACELLRVRWYEWPDIVDDVQFMGRTVARTINAKSANAGS
ncbi:hypothetical protein [Algiphilus sp.]|uniref:hypothetical protein n=1 Tax=Algiphilus sp. TaxID=1872431 RepID=UPI0025BB06BA|nr:hypothetical protein [Algiphilus sp.]MCK5772047.1 hypothetical protein [Algiphilus sp.]